MKQSECDHKDWRQVSEEKLDDDWNWYTEHETVYDYCYEDVDIKRYKCTKCGKQFWY